MPRFHLVLMRVVVCAVLAMLVAACQELGHLGTGAPGTPEATASDLTTVEASAPP